MGSLPALGFIRAACRVRPRHPPVSASPSTGYTYMLPHLAPLRVCRTDCTHHIHLSNVRRKATWLQEVEVEKTAWKQSAGSKPGDTDTNAEDRGRALRKPAVPKKRADMRRGNSHEGDHVATWGTKEPEKTAASAQLSPLVPGLAPSPGILATKPR